MKKRKIKTADLAKVTYVPKLSDFFIHVPHINKTYTLKGFAITRDTLIKDLQDYIELVCGFPCSTQRVHYLDMADLPGSAALHNLEIVHKATFTLRLFQCWIKLFTFIFNDDISGVLQCDIVPNQEDADEKVANGKMLSTNRKQAGVMAIYYAAHLGNRKIIQKLLSLGINVNCQTESGHTPLQAAIIGGHYECIDLLLENGACSDRKSEKFKFVLTLSKLYGHSETERHLLMFEWKSRSINIKSKTTKSALKMQKNLDSCHSTVLDKPNSTKSICTSLPKEEFSDDVLDSITTTSLNTVLDDNTGDEEDFQSCYSSAPAVRRRKTTLSYEDWLERKKEQEPLFKRQEKLEKLERLRQKEKEEDERKNILKKSLRRKETEKQNRLIRDENAEKKKGKTDIYEDYRQIPSYQRLILHQMFNDVSIT